jgi:hypothetical protein
MISKRSAGVKVLSVVECVRKTKKCYSKYFRIASQEINP